MAKKFFIAGYSKAYSRVHFSCGKPELDDWLKTQATQQERSGNTRTFLAVSVAERKVVGYYSTTTFRIDGDQHAAEPGTSRGGYAIPAVLLARMTVDQDHQGQGLGALLLMHAMVEVAKASTSVGFEALVVHALDGDAAQFYRRHGFDWFGGGSDLLWITLKDLLASIPTV